MFLREDRPGMKNQVREVESSKCRLLFAYDCQVTTENETEFVQELD